MDPILQSPVFQALVKEWSGQRFDVKFAARRGYAQLFGTREDASESVMFARELEYVYAKTYDVLYPGLKARTLIPVNREVPTGADSHTYQQYDRVGEAKVVHDYAKDFPTVEVSGKEFSNKIVSLGAGYQYSTQDMRNAAMAKKPLDAMKARAARLAMEESLEKIAALGTADFDDARSIKGLLNAPNVDTCTLSNGDWAATLAAATTFDDQDKALNYIQQDVAQMRNQIWTSTKTVHGNSGLTLLVDTETYAFLESTPQSPRFKDQSIADFLLRTVPALSSIEYWIQCDTADSGDPKIMLYEKSPEICELIIPQEFEQFPPQLEGMAFKVFCHMRTGGVSVRRPKACVYATNHTS